MSPNDLWKTGMPQISTFKTPFAMAPADLLIEIALFLETSLDILNFSLTVRPLCSEWPCSTNLYQLSVTACLFECLTGPLRVRRVALCWTVRRYLGNAAKTTRHCSTCARACDQTPSKVPSSQPFRQPCCVFGCATSCRCNVSGCLGQISLGCRRNAIFGGHVVRLASRVCLKSSC